MLDSGMADDSKKIRTKKKKKSEEVFEEGEESWWGNPLRLCSYAKPKRSSAIAS
jgi:hypothetical protein